MATMTLEGFYTLLLPEEGTKFVAVHNKYFTHHSVSSIQEMAQKTRDFDAAGKTTYFACASYIAPSFNANGKTVYRVQENILGAKSLWWDIDCGPNKDYPDQPTALIKLQAFLAQSGVPNPMIVNSGNGLHCYWPLDEMVDPKRWKQMATLLHELAQFYSFKMDPSRSRDMTSVLRPIETHNRKSTPKLVDIIAECAPFPVDEFTRGLLRQYKSVCPSMPSGASLPTRPASTAVSINDDLVGPARKFPPSSADAVASNCAQIAYFRDTGSDNEPHWRASLNTIKHCVDGEAIAHAWSSTHSNYSQAETQDKMDRWTKGPPECETFANYNGMCDKCPSRGKIKHPIHLGLTLEVGEQAEVIEIEAAREEIKLPWGISVSSRGRLQMRSENPKTKVVSDIEFCDIFFYMYTRVKDLDGVMSVGINARIRQREDGSFEWKKFMLPTSVIGERGTKLRSELGKYEIVAIRGQDEKLETYMQRYLDMLRANQKEVVSYRTLGTQEDGSVLVGTTLYKPDGTNTEVIVSSPGASNLMPAFNIKNGDADHQRKLLMEAYGHPDHEQYQFQTLVSLGSIIVGMCGIDTGSIWNLHGARGKGKTTACEMGLALWGDPKLLSVKWGKDGTTDNAFFARVSASHTLPVLLDEVTNIKAEEMSALSYQLQSGRTKEVLDRNRKPVPLLPPWQLMTWLTSNSSLQDILATGKDDASAELTRSIQIAWRGDVDTISKADMTRILYSMHSVYGSIGREWAQYVAINREQIRETLFKTQNKIDQIFGFAKEQRYWSVAAAACATAGFLSEQEGILPFASKPLFNWMGTQLRQNMQVATDYVSSMDDSFHRMITAVGPSTIFTDKEGDARVDRVPVLGLQGEPVARVIRNTGEMYISISAIRDWCVKRQVGYSALRDAAVALGILQNPDIKFYVGKGTDRPTGQLRCWKLDWNKLQGV